MTTALDMITDALRLVNVIDQNDAPSAEMGVNGLRSLNELLKDWEEDGIRLGYYTVTALDEELPLQERDLRAVKFNFAVELAGEYGIEPTPRVAEIAAQTYARLAKRAVQHVELSMDHLPMAEPYFGLQTREME
jgi:hypothetical protein